MWWIVNLCIASLCVTWTTHFVNGFDFILPGDVIPSHYDLKLLFDIDPSTNFSFFGVVDILLKTSKPTIKIVLHAKSINIVQEKVRLIVVGARTRGETTNNDFAITDVKIDNINEFLILEVDQELLISETYSLTIPFFGNVNVDLTGIYIDSYNDSKTMAKEYYITSFFEPMNARMAFPCFDEPIYKATFKLTIGHHKYYHALSNMPLESTSDIVENPFGSHASWPWNITKYKNNFVWDKFENSVKMSTYVVSFVVSKFLYVEVPNHKQIKMKIWARPDVIDQAMYAVSITPKIMSYLEKIFNISYPLPKVDHVALRSFMFGGFEGWGLITYKEYYLLYDELQSSIVQKKWITQVISHEMAHQWFGDLITMKWWNEIWLKEGFATYMADLAAEAVWPETKDTEIVTDIMEVFRVDAMRTAHPITAPMEATNPKRIWEVYSPISYKKGKILLRMLHHSLGEVVFKEALYKYMAENSYKCTAEVDLWKHLSEASIKHHALPNNVTVAHIMSSWTSQAGYPLLTVQRDYIANSLSIYQHRYIKEEGPLRKARSARSWWVPLSVLAQHDKEMTPLITWLANDEGINQPHQYKHAAGEDEWLLFNVDILALCRINYDSRNWGLLISALTHGNYTKIPVLSRVQLLADAFDLAWTNVLDYGTALELASYLHREEDHRPLEIGLKMLNFIRNVLQRSSEYSVFKDYVRRLLEKTYEKFGGLANNTSRRSSDYNEVMIQVELTNVWVCEIIPACEDYALKLFQQWMNTTDPDTYSPIPVDFRETVYKLGVARGSARHWRFMLERTRSKNLESAILAKKALVYTNDPSLLRRTLEMAMTENVFGDLSARIIHEALMTPVGFYVTKDFIYQESETIFARMDPTDWVNIVVLPAQITSRRDLSEFLNWRDKNAKLLQSSAHNIDIGIEMAHNNIDWFERNRKLVVDKLKQFTQFSKARKNLALEIQATSLVLES